MKIIPTVLAAIFIFVALFGGFDVVSEISILFLAIGTILLLYGLFSKNKIGLERIDRKIKTKWMLFVFGVAVAVTPFVINVVPEDWTPFALGVGIALILIGFLTKKGELN